jgi:hypothetical protein
MIISSDNIDSSLFERAKASKSISEAHEAWVKSRGGRMTASSVWQLFTAKLAQASNETVEKYIMEKVAEYFGAYNPSFSSAATTWGHKNELEAVEEYEKRTGQEVRNKGDQQAFIPHLEFGGCTPDGLIGQDGGLQVKCPYNPANHIKYLMLQDQNDLKLKEHKYYVQVQTELMVTGRKWWDFVSYDPRIEEPKLRLKILRVYPDPYFLPTLDAALEDANEKMKTIIEQLKNITT